MNGTVTFEQLYAFLGLFATAGGLVAGAVTVLWRIVVTLRKAYLRDIGELDSKIVAQSKNLADYKQHAAEHFASKDGVTTQIDRLEQSVRDVADRVDASGVRITDRIDRLLEAQARPLSRRTSS